MILAGGLRPPTHPPRRAVDESKRSRPRDGFRQHTGRRVAQRAAEAGTPATTGYTTGRPLTGVNTTFPGWPAQRGYRRVKAVGKPTRRQSRRGWHGYTTRRHAFTTVHPHYRVRRPAKIDHSYPVRIIRKPSVIRRWLASGREAARRVGVNSGDGVSPGCVPMPAGRSFAAALFRGNRSRRQPPYARHPGNVVFTPVNGLPVV